MLQSEPSPFFSRRYTIWAAGSIDMYSLFPSSCTVAVLFPELLNPLWHGVKGDAEHNITCGAMQAEGSSGGQDYVVAGQVRLSDC